MPVIVPVTMALDDALHCPFCGIQTLGNEPDPARGGQSFKECQHLLFVATGEGGLEWCRPDLAERLEKINFNNEGSVKRMKIGGSPPNNFLIFQVGDFEFCAYAGYEKKV